jgi:hypothetical protein
MSVSPDGQAGPSADAADVNAPGRESSPWWRRGARAFGRFWWDFLVGDTPELLVGALAAIGIVALLVHGHDVRAVVVGALPVLIVALLALSTFRARSRVRRRTGRPSSAPETGLP